MSSLSTNEFSFWKFQLGFWHQNLWLEQYPTLEKGRKEEGEGIGEIERKREKKKKKKKRKNNNGILYLDYEFWDLGQHPKKLGITTQITHLQQQTTFHNTKGNNV